MSPERRPTGTAGRSAVLTLALAAAGSFAGIPGLSAQTDEELDTGTYELLSNGEVIGVERFVVRSDGTAIRAAGRVTSSRATGSLGPGEVRLQLDEEFRAQRFELKPSEGPLTSVVGLRFGNRFRVQTDSEAGERVKEYVAPARLAVLERGFAHHYFLLLQLMHGDAGPGQLSLVVPSEGKQFRATVRDEGEDRVPINGGTATARRYAIEGGGETHTVWASNDGRVLRVEVPAMGWAAQRRP